MTHESFTESVYGSQQPMQPDDSDAEHEPVEPVEERAQSAPRRGLLAMIVGFFYRSRSERERERSQRLRELNVSIEMSPDSPTNFVLRGELFLERREYHLAKADFETALELADAYEMDEGWGLIEQTMQDRALEHLKKLSAD